MLERLGVRRHAARVRPEQPNTVPPRREHVCKDDALLAAAEGEEHALVSLKQRGEPERLKAVTADIGFGKR